MQERPGTFLLLIAVLALLSQAQVTCGAPGSGDRNEPDGPSVAAQPGGTERPKPSSDPRGAGPSGRVIVRYARGGNVAETGAKILERVEGARSKESLEAANSEVFEVRGSLGRAVRDMEGVAGVKYVERSQRGFETFSSDDSYYKRGKQWALEEVDAGKSWDLSRGEIRPGPDVGVLTTGYARHPDLEGKVVSEHDCGDNDARANPSGVHGTHVAGIVGAATSNGRGIAGVAPEADLFVGRVFSKGGGLRIESVVECGDLAMKRGVKVISISLGFLPGEPASAAGRQTLEKPRHQRRGLSWQLRPDGAQALRTPGLPGRHRRRDRGRRHRTGRRQMAGLRRGGVDIAAPGKEIVSTSFKRGGEPAYEPFSGTSQAVPHVAGALACARAKGKSRIEAERDMLKRAPDRGPPGRDDYFGHGALNMLGAVRG